MKAYVFQAALWCEDCTAAHVLQVPRDSIAREIARRRKAHGIPEGATDTDNVPDGPHGDGGGEADSPQHCDECGEFLRNPLTPDGFEYVRDAIQEHNEHGTGSRDVLETWHDFYNDNPRRFGQVLPELKGA